MGAESLTPAAAPGPALEAARDAAAAVRSRLGRVWEGPVLALVTLVLLAFGLIALYSASAILARRLGLPDYHFLARQLGGAAIGAVALLVAARVDYRWWRALAWPVLGIALALLALLLLPWTQELAPMINGARRWLVLGSVTVQPSELAKLAVLVWTAALAVKKQDRLGSLSRGLLPFLVVWAVVELLIFLQPDLSSALLILLLAGLVVFAAGARIGHFLLLGLVVMPLLWARVEMVGYQLRRIAGFVDPSHDPAGLSYQVNQSLLSLGSGGLTGLGLGSGQQKFGFLPEPHNDFIFAMIGEEWGFLGTSGVILLFTVFGLVGYRIARQAPDLFGFLLAVGLTNLIVVQALLHMSVTMALVPTTGITLPFISYGRSSLIVCLVAVGILLSIARAGAQARRGASPARPKRRPARTPSGAPAAEGAAW